MERVSPNPASSGEPAVDAEAALSRAPPVPWSSVEAFCFHHAHVATHRHIVTRPHAPPLVPEAAAVSATVVSAAAAPARGGSRLAAPREGTPRAGKGARGGFETMKPDARFTLPPRGWDPPPPELAQLEGRPTPNETASSPPRLPRIVGSLVDPACDHPPREFADAALFAFAPLASATVASTARAFHDRGLVEEAALHWNRSARTRLDETRGADDASAARAIMAAARCVRASDATREPGHSFYPRRLAESYRALAKAMRERLGLDSIHVDVDGGEEW
jgi:hypothetical protein